MKRFKTVIEDVIVQSDKIQPIIGKIDMSRYNSILYLNNTISYISSVILTIKCIIILFIIHI